MPHDKSFWVLKYIALLQAVNNAPTLVLDLEPKFLGSNLVNIANCSTKQNVNTWKTQSMNSARFYQMST